MASAFGPSSPTTTSRNVFVRKPTRIEAVWRTASECTLSQENNGDKSPANTGSTITPSPRLATVMPNCVAPMVVSRWRRSPRAILARRCPLAINRSSWVWRIFTRANSAATKNPFSSTNAATPSSLSKIRGSSSMLQTHFAEDDLEDVLQTDEAQFHAARSHHNPHALPRSLHLAQGHFQAQLVVEVEGGLQKLRGGLVLVQAKLKQQRPYVHQPGDAAAPLACFPDRQPAETSLPAQREQLSHRRLHRHGNRFGQRDGNLAHGQVLEVEHAVDHRSFLAREALRGFLHHGAQFIAVAEQMTGKSLATRPTQQTPGKQGHERNNRLEGEVDEPEWDGHHHAKAVRIQAEQRLRH